MPNTFDGPPEGRQSDDADLPTSRFRPRYRALTDDELELHDAIKAKAAEVEALFDRVPPPRQPSATPYPAQAIHYLELAVVLAVKALTA